MAYHGYWEWCKRNLRVQKRSAPNIKPFCTDLHWQLQILHLSFSLLFTAYQRILVFSLIFLHICSDQLHLSEFTVNPNLYTKLWLFGHAPFFIPKLTWDNPCQIKKGYRKLWHEVVMKSGAVFVWRRDTDPPSWPPCWPCRRCWGFPARRQPGWSSCGRRHRPLGTAGSHWTWLEDNQNWNSPSSEDSRVRTKPALYIFMSTPAEMNEHTWVSLWETRDGLTLSALERSLQCKWWNAFQTLHI